MSQLQDIYDKYYLERPNSMKIYQKLIDSDFGSKGSVRAPHMPRKPRTKPATPAQVEQEQQNSRVRGLFNKLKR